jgi:hypothetical protein
VVDGVSNLDKSEQSETEDGQNVSNEWTLVTRRNTKMTNNSAKYEGEKSNSVLKPHTLKIIPS